MLGEIVLPQWRCLAELVDNSIDSFLEASRAGKPIANPLVSISTPTATASSGRLSVRDNGPGMDSDTLERAARAGWTSHDPINNLGLFGMGFNIATARLGSRTSIWTTRSGDREWVGIQIDFEQLVRQQAFITPATTRPKATPEASGTEVIIERLKPEQLDWFARGYNRTNVGKQLGRIYSSMLGPARMPVGFRLELNGNQVQPKLHCIWGGPGNPPRVVETVRHGAVDSFQPFDVTLEPRPFCTQCWNWLGAAQTSCPACGVEGVIVERKRRVHGWLGIQRYLDKDDFGIDILRNGRKIEVANKDLFTWFDENTNTSATEYPIDDPRDRGRIVGEVHLDHCRVPYTKDRFVREDAAWREMTEIVRGTTPLRPELAGRTGSGPNNSPLYRLFQAFRRSNPHNRRAGGWSRILVVPDNDRAQAMAKRFDAGEAEYQTDERWWELVHEAEAATLHVGSAASPGETLGGESHTSAQYHPPPNASQSSAVNESPAPSTPVPPTARTRIASLSRQYADDLSGQRYEIEAFSVGNADPALEGNCPWNIRRLTTGSWQFFLNPDASAFRSMTFTPLDALLAQLAWLIADFERGQGSRWSFGEILVSLREKYARTLFLDPQELVSQSMAQLVDIARSIVGRISTEDSHAFFDALAPSKQEATRVAMASRGVANPHGAIDDGRFLQYSAPGIIADFVLANPEAFFDGAYWDDPYSTLDYGSAAATEEARGRLLGHFGALLADVVWLAKQTPSDLQAMSRERLMRASLATSLLGRTANAPEVE